MEMLVMDVVLLSRLQFAVATLFHFLFVPLTLGLSILVAIMESIYVKTDDEEYKRMVKFWGKIFLINFAVGIVTGITLEFQFGTNWAGYSKYVGDVFGSLLAIEATVAFFLESTFIAVWVFGWNKVSPRIHLACIWLVAIASSMSAYWILAANSWMQHPVGYVIRNGRAELVRFPGGDNSAFCDFDVSACDIRRVHCRRFLGHGGKLVSSITQEQCLAVFQIFQDCADIYPGFFSRGSCRA
jgi:cytochrome bd ubiquinol oxidase subunit I